MTPAETLRSQLLTFLDFDANWYKSWYFDLRLEEEVQRCLRYNQSAAVISISFVAPVDERGQKQLRELLGWLANAKLRSTDILGILADGELAVLLPHADRAGATVVVGRLLGGLVDYAPQSGIAVCPEDGGSAEQILSRARRHRSLAA